MKEIQGIVVLGFGPQDLDFFAKCQKVTGKDAIVSPDLARMAGANLAAGTPAGLDALRERLEAGAMQAEKAAHPSLTILPGAVAWLASGRRGISSNTMFTHLTGVDALNGDPGSHPWDPDDLDRCLALLDAIPDLRERLPLMSSVSRQWAALVAHWDEIESSHLDEVGLGWTKAKAAPKTYALMKRVLAAA